jgi:GT2 family glycosyltransferase
MMSDAGINVVVVNYHTFHDLKKFIESYMYQGSKIKTTLTVADVETTEENEVRNYLQTLKIKSSYISFKENVGYATACNISSNHYSKKFDTLAFFNADTQLYDSTLDDVYTYLHSDDSYGIAGPLQVDSKGRVTHAGIFGTTKKPILRSFRKPVTSQLTFNRDDAVSVSGSAYFVKRKCWNELLSCSIFREKYPTVSGAFLPTPHYYEETFCSYHALHHGWKVVYVGSAIMEHEWHQSSTVGEVEKKFLPTSRKMFREMCDFHDIERD